MKYELLKTKLHIPPLRPSLVPRPRLIEKLNTGQSSKLTLVSAPAGFGKTTLIAEWVQANERASAWLSLDEGDNDLARFWHYVVASLNHVLKMDDLGAGLRSVAQSQIDIALPGFINELTILTQAINLVLDDYHIINTQTIHQTLAFFLDHMPVNVHLVIVSRTNPPLPLARLRVRHQLMELTSEALRFTPEETAVFLNDIMDLDISVNDITALEARTEGWIAGLQVAALSLQGRPDKTAFIKEFSGSHRHLLDYLAEEVLREQPSIVQTFLLHTSVLDRLTAPLCDAVLEQNGRPQIDSQAMLARIEKSNLFLVPLDDERQWYRYHHLFAEFLHGRLLESDPELARVLHRQASKWYETNGYIEAAVSQALAAADHERAARLLEQMARTGWRDMQGITFLRWLQALPEELIHARPRLALHYAWCLLQTGKFEMVTSWLETAETKLRQSASALPPNIPSHSDAMLGEVEAMRAVLACYRGDIAEAMSRSRQALTQLPHDDVHMRGLVASNIAMNIGDEATASGDFEIATQIYKEIAVTGSATNVAQMTAFALNRLTQMQLMQGSLHLAADTVNQVLALKLDETLPGEMGIAHMNKAELSYEWNRLHDARHHWESGIERLRLVKSASIPGVYVSLAMVLQAQGDQYGARLQMKKALNQAQQTNITWVASRVRAMSALLALRQADMPTAVRWAETCGLDVGDDINITRVGEYAILARIEFARGNGKQALALLNWLYDFVSRIDLRGFMAEFLILQAIILKSEHKQSQSLAKFQQALALAEPEGYIRLFVDEGEPVAQLLASAITQDLYAEYGRSLLAVLNQEKTPSVSRHVDALSERELDVLRLLAADLQSPQIASELTIAVSTVRSHIKSIYSKLQVHSRYEAVVRAQELDLV